MSVLLSVENPEKRALFKGVFDRAKAIFAPDNFPEHEVQKILQELAAADEFLKKGGEWLESYKIGRRPLLKVIGMSAAGLALATNVSSFVLPPQARAEEEWIELGPDPGELNQAEYFPFDKRVARDKKRVRLSNRGASLDVHDIVLGHHGPRGHAREWQEDYENRSLRKEPGKREWMGDCQATAAVMAYRRLLIPEVLEGGSFLYEGLEIDKTKVIGLYAARDAHDAMLALRKDPMGIAALLVAAIKRGDSPVAFIFKDGGIWNYVVTKARVDLGEVEIQNFGEIRQISIDQIAGIYFPRFYNPKDPSSLQTVQGIDEEIRKITSGYYNPELNYDVVDSITQNQPLG